MAGKFKLAVIAAFAVLPSPLTCFCYRLFFGYKIGKRVRIGFSIIDAAECEIGDDVSIGHFNVFTRTTKLSIGDHTRIGVLNIFRGGDEIRIGRYCEILRLNEINSIPEPDVVDDPVREEKRILRNESDEIAVVVDTCLREVHAVDEDLARGREMKRRDQRDQRALS